MSALVRCLVMALVLGAAALGASAQVPGGRGDVDHMPDWRVPPDDVEYLGAVLCGALIRVAQDMSVRPGRGRDFASAKRMFDGWAGTRLVEADVKAGREAVDISARVGAAIEASRKDFVETAGAGTITARRLRLLEQHQADLDLCMFQSDLSHFNLTVGG
jgi:hypothetical protein